MGQAAVQAVRARMLTGYDEAVYDSGALYQDVQARCEGPTAVVGNTLPYAVAVHEGNSRRAGRPYLAEGVLGAAEGIVHAAETMLMTAG